MFTIDLLKGEGVPIKSRPEEIAIALVMIIVPIIVAIAMLSFYLRNKITISIQKKEIVRCKAEIGKLSDAVETQETLEEEKIIVNSCISEVRSSLGRHTQWSPILANVVENMPSSVALTSLDVSQRTVKKKVPQKDDPEKMTDISILVRTLHMSVYGSTQSDCGEAIRTFRNHLLSSPFLGPMLENITVSQRQGTVEGQDVISYEIDCIFKPKT